MASNKTSEAAREIGWWILRVRRNDQPKRDEGLVRGCGLHELESFLSQPGVEVLPYPYNPPGCAGSLREGA